MVSRTLRTGRVETKGISMPPNYPKPTVFCDCNHRQGCMDKPSFAFGHAPLSVSTWMPVDVIKLKQNTSFKPIEDFQKAMLNVLGHHFDRHEGYGEWCPTKKWKNEPEKLKQLCCRNKDRNRKTYLQIQTIRAPFFTVEKPEEMRHSHDTNKCENIMKVITKYHPKNMMFYETCIAKAHILAAIGKDSIGLLG
jgi:hypothetical protein